MSTPSLSLPSFAKINLSLRVLGRRPDGYHEIRTVMQTISLRDELQFSRNRNREVVLSCDDPQIPTGEENLVSRAAQALRDHAGSTFGASIRLEKRIPTKGGLGGASSNAAITLLALAKLWELEVGLADLIEIASALGADVPFFLIGGRALATGTGTRVQAIAEDDATHLLIVTPKRGVSTAAAYRSLNATALTSTGDNSILSISRAEADSRSRDPWGLRNDFEEVIFKSEPEIHRAKEALEAAGAKGSLLSGSGSSVFGIFENEQAQEQAVNEIKTEIGWRIFPAVTISRPEYLRALGPCGVLLSRSESEV